MVKRFRESDLGERGDKGPKWDGKQKTFTSYWYDMKTYLKLQKLGETVDGSNRDLKDSDKPLERAQYERLNVKLWWYIMRSISNVTPEGESLRLLIRDDFEDDTDGYELVKYLQGYANDQTPTDVKKLKKKIEDTTFKTSDSPTLWRLQMQRLRKRWLQVPVARRGGGEEELVELLLDKVGEAKATYVAFVRAVIFAKGGEGLGDYQAVAKLLEEQHKQSYKGRTSDSDSDSEVKRASTKKPKAPGAEAFAGWTDKPGGKPGGKQGSKPGKDECGRCGKKGHFKRDCTAKCSVCGLQCCGGVRDPKRCMVRGGIPPSFRKIMEKNEGSKAAIAKIEKRAKEMGITHANLTEAEAEMMSTISAEEIDEFFIEAGACGECDERGRGGTRGGAPSEMGKIEGVENDAGDLVKRDASEKAIESLRQAGVGGAAALIKLGNRAVAAIEPSRRALRRGAPCEVARHLGDQLGAGVPLGVDGCRQVLAEEHKSLNTRLHHRLEVATRAAHAVAVEVVECECGNAVTRVVGVVNGAEVENCVGLVRGERHHEAAGETATEKCQMSLFDARDTVKFIFMGTYPPPPPRP